MKTVPASFTSTESLFYVSGSLVFVFFLLISFPFQVDAVTLPRSVGRINDYANLLSIEDRKKIKDWLEPISEEGLDLTILASRRDPYSDPEKYFGKIIDKWGLEGGFILFVEEENSWKTVYFLGRKTRALLRSKGLLKSYQSGIEERIAGGDPRDALMFSVRRLFRAVTGEIEAADEGSSFGSWSVPVIPLVFLGGFFVLVLFYGLLRWELNRRCPECGVRMRVKQEESYSASSYKVISKRCGNCGYRETERTEESSFWPFGDR